MSYCRNCGERIDDDTIICPKCGATQSVSSNMNINLESKPQPYQQPASQVVDNGGFLWGLLGCCIPIVGLVLFLVWKDTKPRTAKAAGIGALVSVIIGVLWYVIMFLIGVGGSIAMM